MSSHKPIAFVDLDGTLFRTLRRIPEKEHKTCLCACLNSKGQASSFVTQKDLAFFTWLCQSTECVPTTGRDEAEFSRIVLPLSYEWKIVSFGTAILGSDGLDLAWKHNIETILTAALSQMHEVFAILKKRAPTYRLDFCSIYGLPYAIVLRSREKTPLPSSLVTSLRNIPLPCFFCGADRRIAPYGLLFLAPHIGKDKAVRYLLSKFRKTDPTRPCIGIADQISDVPYLLECDWIWTPTTSEITKLLEITASKELWHDTEQCLLQQE